ncbi:MAG TPA: hypothetical protein VN750_00910 [Steroidobacteraceae bacterium]|nr:hypothetical protein [Steroidobacteraceae bacterium]
MKLRVEFIYLAPDAERYMCIDDSTYDGAPDAGPQLVGRGPTEDDAKADWFDQWMEREIERDINRALKQMKVFDSMLEQLFGRRA